MLINLVSIYLFAAVLLTSFFSTYFLSKSKSRHVRVFCVFSFSLSVYILGYAMEINSYTLEQMKFWNQFQYFSIPFIASLMLLFTILFKNKNYQFKWIQLILVFTIPVISFLARLTNRYHNLYYTDFDVIEASGIRLLDLEKGINYYVQQLHSLTAIIIALVLLLSGIKRKNRSENLQFILLSAATILPFLGILLIVINFSGSGLDYVAILLPGSLLLMTYVLIKFDFLEIRTKAREASFENSPDGLILLDKNYRILDFNKMANRIFPGLSDIKGNFGIDGIAPGNSEMQKAFKNDFPNEFVLSDKQDEFHYDITSSMIFDSHGKITGYLKTLRDITENNKIKEQLRNLATIDSLSGICNRNYFLELAEKEKQKAGESGYPICFLMMDIDNFKAINDKWGHGAGDLIIKEFGKLTKQTFAEGISGRIGGEEFAVVMPGYNIEMGVAIAERFLKIIENMRVWHEQTMISTTVSIGVACSENPETGIEELMKRADKGMYHAKYMGRNRVEIN